MSGFGPGVLIALLTLVLVAAGVVATWAIRISKGESAMDAAKAAQASADEAKADLAKHKLWVAENYVSHTAMSELERRLSDQIKELGVRLERLFHPTPPHP